MEFAFVFPGQGSQSVGMLKELADSHAIVKQTYEEASDAISVDLWKYVTEGPDEVLNETINTQPAMLAASTAIWKIWANTVGHVPKMMAGHSFGEISALTCAGAMSFQNAVVLARKRGELMQNAVPAGTGAMAAILGMSDDDIDQLCKAIGNDDLVVEAVNYNAPGQVVIAGHTRGVDQLIEQAKDHGAKRALKLPVSVPAHSSLMRPAAELFGLELERLEMQLPLPGVLQNASLSVAENVPDLKKSLQEQLYSPVRWVQTVQLLKDNGAGCIVEIGPGKVLTGLHKRIDKSLKSVCVCDNKSLESAINIIGE